MSLNANGRNTVNPSLYYVKRPQQPNNTTSTQQNVQNPNNNTAQGTNVNPAIYRQYLVTNPITLTSTRVNGSEADMHEVYELDRQLFAEQDPYDSYEEFKNIVRNNQLSTYVVKDENNRMLGYYQLEPVKNGDLYIDSIGLKPEYRNSRKGYQTIKYAWEKIQDYARENGANTLSLHVTASNRNLLRMYQNLGFTIKETLHNYYEDGSDAYFMERPLEENNTAEEVTENVENNSTTTTTDVTEEVNEPEINEEQIVPQNEVQDTDTTQQVQQPEQEEVEQEITNQTPVLSQEEQAKILFNQKMEQAKAELLEMGIPEDEISAYLRPCNEADGSSSQKATFNDEIFDCVKGFIKIQDKIIKNEQTKEYSSEKISMNSYFNLIKKLCEKDSEGNISKVRTDLLPYIDSFADAKIEFNYYDDIVVASTETLADGNTHISTKGLKTAKFLKTYNESYHIKDLLNGCKVSNENGRVFDDDALECVKDAFIFGYGNKNIVYYDIENLLTVSKQVDENGNEVFNSNLFRDLKRHLTDENIAYEDKLFWGSNRMRQAYNAGCDMELLLKYGYGKSVLNNKDIDKIIRSIDYDKRDQIKYSLFRACQYNGFSYDWNNHSSKRVTKFDRDVRDKFIELQSAEPPVFEKNELVPEILEACREQEDSYSDYKFNPKLVEKALQLKNSGIFEENIAKILEACKITKTKTYNNEINSIKFSDEIFNAVIQKIHEKDFYRGSDFPIYIECSKDTIDGEEIFRPQNFERITKSYIYAPRYRGAVSSLEFFRNIDKHNKIFDIDLHEKFTKLMCNLETICDSHTEKRTKNQIFTPSETAIDAYKSLNDRDLKFTRREGDTTSTDPKDLIIQACRDEKSYPNYRFNSNTFNKFCELLDKGYDGRDVLDVIYYCKPYKNSGRAFSQKHYNLVNNLLDQGIDIKNAGRITDYCINNENILNENSLNKCLELYNLGIKDPVSALYISGKDDIAYDRLKQAAREDLPYDIIKYCKINGEFQDRLFRLAMNLHEKKFSPDSISKLMETCHEKDSKKVMNNQSFNYEMFNHIADLEELGINRDNISEILKTCKYNNKFSPQAYAKVSNLYYKGYDDKGIAELIKHCNTKNDENGDFEFNEDKYNELLKLTAKHKVLKGLTHDDTYVIEKLINYKNQIDKTTETFGEDVMNNVVTVKIDNYIQFVSNCNQLIDNTSEDFIADLQKRLNTIPSPELKVKRLRVISSLAGKVDESALRTLSSLIKSPEMSEEQVKLANTIFSDDKTDYQTNVDKFIKAISAPENTKKVLREYLLKARLDKQINRPKPIEEQMAQMDAYAQQMLTNPKTPLDKKLKYIEEFKAKKADMQAHPEKYTTPKIFAKPLDGLRKVVQVSVNIPNSDIEFNSSITNVMYKRMGIDANADLLRAIHYDSKYFDKLFSVSSEFVPNFKRLIELQKENPTRPLNEIRLELPEEGTEKYQMYEELGLIDQIKANQDTVRKFKEQNLDFDKWNTFDENLKSETFTVQADPETEYENTKYNLINLFQDEHFNNINPEETQKLHEMLSSRGYVIFNNKLYKNGELISNNDLDKFTELVTNYITTDKYWKSATEGSAELSENEISGVRAFRDHLNDVANHIKEIRGSKTVHDICFRLSDDSDIGRNIFFGNHVGCCNSVDSSYAGYSAPMHLLNNFNRGLELVDKYGNSYGNSMCFFAEVDGELAFVIDSFEANGKLASNPIVTEELIKFGKQVCKEMGREDAQVLIGPNFNHMDESKLKNKTIDNMKIVGTVSTETYCDSVGGRNVKDAINNGKNSVIMKYYAG